MDSRASALVPSNGNPKRTLRVGILQSAARLSEYADAPRFPKQFSTFPLKSVNLPKIGQLGLLFAISGPVALLSNYWGVAGVSFLQSNGRRVSCTLAFKNSCSARVSAEGLFFRFVSSCYLSQISLECKSCWSRWCFWVLECPI